MKTSGYVIIGGTPVHIEAPVVNFREPPYWDATREYCIPTTTDPAPACKAGVPYGNLPKPYTRRYAFRPALRASVAWLSEGDAELIRRNGLVVQGWYEPSFSGDRFTLGLGLGVYIAIDDYREDREGAFPNGVITLTASYRVGRDWRARFSWNRVISNYDRDTDVLMLGAGYRF